MTWPACAFIASESAGSVACSKRHVVVAEAARRSVVKE